MSATCPPQVSTASQIMSVRAIATGPRATLQVSGELDVSSAGQLTDAAAQLRDLHPGEVTIDLADVRFIDARGLSALLETRRGFEVANIRTALRGVPSCVRRLLSITGLAGAFPG